MTASAYAEAGVDVDVEAEASRIMYKASKRTYKNRWGKVGKVETLFDDFAGLRVFNLAALPKGSCGSLGADGAGTKVEIPQRINIYSAIAHDLVAMLADDAAVRGGEPAVIVNVLDVKSLSAKGPFERQNLHKVELLAEGLVDAAEAAGVAVINGEVAQMGACISGYGDFPFNWSGACLWFGNRERLISNKKIRPGNVVVVLRERGLRCNGLSLLRHVYEKYYGPAWHTRPRGMSGMSVGHAASRPSTIYSKFLVHLHGGFDKEPRCRIYGAAHITGGGLPEKLARVLRPSGCGVRLETLFKPAGVMLDCQKLGAISDEDAYRAWCMGQGMALITPDPHIVMAESKKFPGIEARIAGAVEPEPLIHLRSRGAQQPGTVLNFPCSKS